MPIAIHRPLFFQKSLFFSGKLNLWFVLLAKDDRESPFQVLWTARKADKVKVFNRYYLPCHRKLTIYCLGMLKDIELAENAATDTLLALFDSLKKETEIQNPERWLFTVAKNRCLSLLSQQKRRREIIDDIKPSFQTQTFAKGEHQLEAADLKAKIRSLLNEKEAKVWELHQQGYDNREIAKNLDLTEKTAANLKSITRNKLRKGLSGK